MRRQPRSRSRLRRRAAEDVLVRDGVGEVARGHDEARVDHGHDLAHKLAQVVQPVRVELGDVQVGHVQEPEQLRVLAIDRRHVRCRDQQWARRGRSG